MADRVQCYVPMCRRSRPANAFAEWCCGEHWRLAPRREKLLLFRCRRKLRRDPGAPVKALEARLWDRIKTKIIERAVGISA